MINMKRKKFQRVIVFVIAMVVIAAMVLPLIYSMGAI